MVEQKGNSVNGLMVRCWLAVVMICLMTAIPAASSEGDWRQAVGPWSWSFPRDHGSHREFRTEWWYFTGNLTGDNGGPYGYQLTFFRQGIRRNRSEDGNRWTAGDIYLAHFALTDGKGGKFWHFDRSLRAGPGLAGSAEGQMNVWALTWSARMDKEGIRLKAHQKGVAIDLRLTPKKPLVLHGENGLSRKGPKEGQSSYYYSFTDLETKGTLLLPGGGVPIPVTGTSWFDQEFGSNQITAEQVGWDWFAIHLTDGRDLMIYFLRKKDGSVEVTSSGTIVEKDGRSRHVKLGEITMDVLARWKSGRSKGEYPSKWRVRIASAGIDLAFSSIVPDQELVTEASTGVTYWEGAVAGTGTSRGKAVNVVGYVELTGYAGSLGGVF